jgi:peptide chain release factor 2
MDDEDTAAEARREIAALQDVIGQLEVQTLLDGEYDDRPAVVTIRSGAGGDDATDFAEMLLRMYLRWAERHKYTVKVMDTSYAEGAGIKSATFEVDAPYAYGTLSSRPARTVSRGSALRWRRQAADVVRRGRGHSRPRGGRRGRGARRRHPRRRLPLVGPGRPVGQHDRLGRAITHSRRAWSSRCRTRRARSRTAPPRCACCRRACCCSSEEEAAKKKELAGTITASWGDQMRSYFLYGQQLVKDLRTGYEVGNPAVVFDGDLDGLIAAGIRWRKRKDDD